MRKLFNDLWNILEDYRQLITYGYKYDNREYYVPETISYIPAPAPAPTPQEKNYGMGDGIGYGAEYGAEYGAKKEADSLEKIAKEVMQCCKCELCKRKKNSVPGTGVLNPLVMVIGECPGAEEDYQGLPFAGAAGQYLDKWLNAISLDRKTNCFIGNIVKCRPPENRDPQPDEIGQCVGYLKRQISLLSPKAILTVGIISSRIITGQEDEIGKLRGRIYSYEGIPVVVTYHPSAVLRDRSHRAAVWEDLKILRKKLDEIT